MLFSQNWNKDGRPHLAPSFSDGAQLSIPNDLASSESQDKH